MTEIKKNSSSDIISNNTQKSSGMPDARLFTLNEIAAFLVQIQPDDLSEVCLLMESLESFADEKSYSEHREKLFQAAKLVESVLTRTAVEPETALEKAGNIIDDIMEHMDEDTTLSSQQPDSSGHSTEPPQKTEAQSFIPEKMFTELTEDYINENNELITSAEEALLMLETDPDDSEAISTVFRAFHTIKGSSNLLKFNIIADMCHSVESFLSRIRDKEIKLTQDYADLSLLSIDMLKELIGSISIQDIKNGDPVPKPEGYDNLMVLLNDINKESPDSGSGKKPFETEPSSVGITSPEENYMPENPDLDLLTEFVMESADLIANAEESLLSLENDPEDMNSVGTVFRAFHTIKGTAAFLELTILSDLGHLAETLLSRVREGEIRYTGGYADLALRSLDMIKELTSLLQKSLDGKPLRKPDGYDELIHILKNPEKAGISEDADEDPELRIGDILVAQGAINREQAENAASPRIGDILVAQSGTDRYRIEEAAVKANQAHKPLGEMLLNSNVASVEEVGKAIRTQKHLTGKRPQVDASVRVATDRLDRLIDMVGELVIAHSMVAQNGAIMDNRNHDLIKKVSHTSKIVRELQDLAMSLRMVPLKPTFNKMTRLVRDLSRKMGKHINFIIDGEDTEIDRNMAEAINDPLIHMLRNAVDHGIESPEERKKSGKSIEGLVKLSAFHAGGNIVVEIKDNGKGIDRDAVIAKAKERGLVKDGVTMTDREVFNLLFEPGFSTAKEVTDVSGRGVGMDVVRKNVETIHGQIEIQSVLGKGSTFQMKLPLTLAIIDGMVIRVSSETFVIPTLSIVTSLKPEIKNISTVFKQGQMLSLQGKLIPLFRLNNVFDIPYIEKENNTELIVVVEEGNKLAGLIIDELVGRHQVVIKSLGESLRNIPGISGGAIMPNGKVGLILDIGSLIRLANQNSRTESK